MQSFAGHAEALLGENNILEARPLATLEDVLVPLYMLHRYQVKRRASSLAGMLQRFRCAGDGQTADRRFSRPAEQRARWRAVLGKR